MNDTATHESVETADPHWPGRLTLGRYFSSNPAHEALAIWPDGVRTGEIGHPVALLTPMDKLTPGDDANARRIVALWNALALIPTDAIEAVAEVTNPAARLDALYRAVNFARRTMLRALASDTQCRQPGEPEQPVDL